MDERDLRKSLAGLPLGESRYFDRIGSTNDVALTLATEGAPDMSLVSADEQTAGRGRGGRQWFTPPGVALAFSLVLRPSPDEEHSIARFTALGALAIVDALKTLDLKPEIKWPNDILLSRRKVAGILVEVVWHGESVDSLVLGIGINVQAGAIPPPEFLNFPATCLEVESGRSIDRLVLLREILTTLLSWRSMLSTEKFLRAWDASLAFRGEKVEVWTEGMPVKPGQVEGLEPDGSLRLLSPQGQVFSVQFGEVHLRPVV